MMSPCKACGHHTTDETLFCVKCGAKLAKQEQKRICSNLNYENEIADDMVFCSKCGTKYMDSIPHNVQQQTSTAYNRNNGGTTKRGFIDNFIYVLKNSTNFYGRASRSEFWQYILARGLIALLLTGLVSVIGISETFSDKIDALVFLVFLLPDLACTVRRLHDVGKTGWWCLLHLLSISFFYDINFVGKSVFLLMTIGMFYLFYLLVKAGNKDDNKYGANSFE